MVKERKLRRWLVSVLSGAIVATTVLGTSVVAFATEDDGFTAPTESTAGSSADESGSQDNSSQEPAQDAPQEVPQQQEPEVKENITESGNGLVITNNSDGSKDVSYDKEVIGMLTEESASKVVDEKTAEQEQIKADIEGQGGSYSYTIESGEAIVFATEVTSGLSETEKKDKVDELEQTESVRKDSIKVDEKTEKKTEEKKFTDQESADNYAKKLVEDDDKITEATAVLINDGVTAEQTDFAETEDYTDEDGHDVWVYDGYHIVELGLETVILPGNVYIYKGQYKIVITGGLEEIDLDIDWISRNYIAEPCDTFEATFIIENQSGDDYEIVDHNSTLDDMGRVISASEYNEDEHGKKKYTIGKNYVVYEPNVIHIINGRDEFRSKNSIKDLAIAYYYAEDTNHDGVKDPSERKTWAENHQNITEEELLQFYRDVITVEEGVDKNSLSAYDLWFEFFKQYCMINSYEANGIEVDSNDALFKNLDLSADAEAMLKWTLTLDGPYMDNTYQMMVAETIKDQLKLRTLKQFKIEYLETTYTITYDVETEGFVVTIDGSGYIPGGGGGGDDPTPDPDPDPTPTDTLTPGDAPAVLGAQRAVEAPAVLGARRAGTSDETNMVLRLILIAASASVLVFARKKSENR